MNEFEAILILKVELDSHDERTADRKLHNALTHLKAANPTLKFTVELPPMWRERENAQPS